MKEAIQNKATQLFFSYGLRSVSMDDVAGNLGMSKKTLYQYFTNKHDLVSNVADHFIAVHQQLLLQCVQQAKNAVHQVILQSEANFSWLTSIASSFMFELEKYYGEVWQKVNEYKRDFVLPHLQGTLKRGVNEGLFRKEIDVVLTAEIRLQQVNTTLKPKEITTRPIQPLQLMQELTRFYLHSITTTKGKNFINTYTNQNNEN